MSVVDLKSRAKRRCKRAPRDLVAIDKTSGAARYFDKMVRDIQSDCGGRRELSRIEDELIAAFCGAATSLRYLNHQVMLGVLSDVNLAAYANVASTMLRIGSRLGLQRRARPLPTLDEFLRHRARANGEPTTSEVVE